MKKKILLIESSDIGAGYTAEAVLGLGFEPVFLCDLKSYAADPLAQIKKYAHHDCDTSTAESVLGRIDQLRLQGIAGVISTADTRLKVALEVSQALRVPGLDPSVANLKDKNWVAQILPEFSPASVSFSGRDIPHALIAALFELSPQVIVKPISGAGGFGTIYLRGREEAASLEARISAHTVPSCMGEERWIAQPVVKGELVSVEGFSINGQVHTLGFSNRKKVGCTETAARFPVCSTLGPAAVEQAKKACELLVKRAKFLNGYFHIEFMMTAQDAFMIDANMGRVGGGAIAEQLALAFGLKPRDVFRHILEVTLFSDPELGHPYVGTPKETFAVFYGIDHADRLLRVSLPEGHKGNHTQILDSGSPVAALGANDWSWVGILSGLAGDVEETMKSIKVHTEQGEFAPIY
jgi:hypothetical protein